MQTDIDRVLRFPEVITVTGFKRSTIYKKIARGQFAAYQNIVQGALNDLEAQHTPALAGVSTTPVDTAPIVQRLQSKISPTMAPADASAIQELIGRVKQAKTLGDLNTFRQELNTETAPVYRQTQVQAGRTGVSSQVTDDLNGWVRNAYYDNLQQATGTDFAPLKRQEANLFTTQEALQNQQSGLARAEAQFSAPSTLREKAGNAANFIRDPKTAVTQTFLRESPATKVATLLQKSLDDLPDAAAPTTAVPAGTPQQPGTAARPQLGTGQPPVIQGTPVTPPQPGAPGLPARGAPVTTPPPQSPFALRGRPSPQLPASTAGYAPTPASPPPPVNEPTATMRVQPNQFASRPMPTPSSGPAPVSPEGQAGVPASRYLGTGSKFRQQGAENIDAHIAADPSSGITEGDINSLARTAKGQGLLTRASSLKPGSAAMKALIKQIGGMLGK